MGFFNWVFRYESLGGFSPYSRTGAMLINSVKLKRVDSKLSRVFYQLKNYYKPDKISAMFRKYRKAGITPSTWGSKERRLNNFRENLDRFTSDFLEDFRRFRAYVTYSFELSRRALVTGDVQENSNLTQIEVLFNKMESNIDLLIFPKDEITEFKRECMKLIFVIEGNLYKKRNNSVKVQQGAHAVTFFSSLRWIGLRKIYSLERNNLLDLDKNLQNYLKLYIEANNQLDTHTIKQDFLFVLIELFKRIDILDQNLKIISLDVQEVVKRLRDEVDIVRKNVADIAELLKNENMVKQEQRDLIKTLNTDVDGLQDYVGKLENKEYLNQNALLNELKKIKNKESALIDEMRKRGK